jgi:hypothetical protein
MKQVSFKSQLILKLTPIFNLFLGARELKDKGIDVKSTEDSSESTTILMETGDGSESSESSSSTVKVTICVP